MSCDRVVEPQDGLTAPTVDDVVSQSARCKKRVLEREGIPMFVALHDSRPGRRLHVRDLRAVAEGARLALLLDHYERGLAMTEVDPAATGDQPTPDHSPDPTGAAEMIEILVVLSDQHLRARPVLS